MVFVGMFWVVLGFGFGICSRVIRALFVERRPDYLASGGPLLCHRCLVEAATVRFISAGLTQQFVRVVRPVDRPHVAHHHGSIICVRHGSLGENDDVVWGSLVVTAVGFFGAWRQTRFVLVVIWGMLSGQEVFL